jgi:hypothetical protein
MKKASRTAIPRLFMRGGLSKGRFFNESDLPANVATRDIQLPFAPDGGVAKQRDEAKTRRTLTKN